MTVTIRQLDRAYAPMWDAFVAAHGAGTFCHYAGWKFAIETGAGHECPYLFAERDGAIVGILPLTLRRSALFGKAMISSMFAVYGGVLCAEDDADVRASLTEAAWSLAQAAGIDVIEYRTLDAAHQGSFGWAQPEAKAATFIRDLPQENDDAVLLSIPRKQRAVVRKSLTHGLVADRTAGVEEFYHLYAVSVRNLGTPVFPLKLFKALIREFPDQHDLLVVRTPDGKALASLMSFFDRKTILPYYAGGIPDARAYGAHDFMYFDLMCFARARGIKYFDFGRSKIGTGPYSFKKNWGFEPTLLDYEYQLAPGAAVPDLSPQNKKYALMVKVWKHLPLWAANLAGPMFARHLG